MQKINRNVNESISKSLASKMSPLTSSESWPGSLLLALRDFLVHCRDVPLEVLLSYSSLHLKGAGQEAVLDGTKLVPQSELSGSLQASQLLLSCQSPHLLLNHGLEVGILAQLFHLLLLVLEETPLLGPLHDPGLLGDHHADSRVLEGVAVHEALSDHRR